MRRAATVAVLLLLPTLATAAASDRYLVALERGTAAVRGTAFLRDIDGEAAPRERRVISFRTIDGFAADLTTDEVSRLRRMTGVRYVEPVVERHILSADLSAATNAKWNLSGQNVPAGLDVVRARDVWPVSRGAGINVAVVDTGVDYTHTDLAPVFAGGYNALTRTNNPMDDNNHGTHVAGTIAAVDNNFGVVGVAPQVRLWGVKVLGSDGRGGSDTVAAGIDWVVQQKKNRGGNWIINMSLGSSELSDFEREVIDRALAEGILIVAASGNDSTSTIPRPVSYPAAYPGVLAIGALNTDGRLASFSNQGPELTAVAPGVDVVSTVRMGAAKIAAVENGTSTFVGSALDGSKNGTINGRFVFCGIGKEGEFPPNVAGSIAVIRRGELTFAEKTKRAKEAGATAVIIVNNVAGPFTNSFTLIDPEDPATQSFEWPVTIMLTMDNGNSLLARSGDMITMMAAPFDYGTKQGTSMASPHAAGVAALAWAVAPNATNTQLRTALIMTATDLGSAGFDSVYGYGVLDALNAAKMLNPVVFGLPSIPEDPGPSGRRSLRRGR